MCAAMREECLGVKTYLQCMGMNSIVKSALTLYFSINPSILLIGLDDDEVYCIYRMMPRYSPLIMSNAMQFYTQ